MIALNDNGGSCLFSFFFCIYVEAIIENVC